MSSIRNTPEVKEAYNAIESQLKRLETGMKIYPNDARFKNAHKEMRLVKKKLNVAVATVNRQRTLGIPAPKNQSPESLQRVENYFTRKAKRAIQNENNVEAEFASLNANIAASRVPQHMATLKEIRAGLANAAAAGAGNGAAAGAVFPPLSMPVKSPYPVRIGGKSRRLRRRDRKTRRNK